MLSGLGPLPGRRIGPPFGQAPTKLLMLDVGRSRSVQLLRVVFWLALGWLVVIAIPEFLSI